MNFNPPTYTHAPTSHNSCILLSRVLSFTILPEQVDLHIQGPEGSGFLETISVTHEESIDWWKTYYMEIFFRTRVHNQ